MFKQGKVCISIFHTFKQGGVFILTIPVTCISESCIEIRSPIFIFTIFIFIKPFEAPQRSVKIKISLNFLSSSGIGMERVKSL